MSRSAVIPGARRARRARKRFNRLPCVTLALVFMFAIGDAGCRRGTSPLAKTRVVVLGLDGMDWHVANRLVAEGRMPGLARLAREGGFTPLLSSVPPQSPVAWSNFITGMDAGGHGVFDFIHRDPKTMTPFFSTSRAIEGRRALTFGDWRLPLEGGSVELLRRGTAFWEVLEEHGVPTAIFRIPANFPPSGTASVELSGMGTPDILGTYGTFSYYTSDRFAFLGQQISGGDVHRVEIEDGVARAKLHGPENPFRVKPEEATADFSVFIDPENPVAKIVVGDEERILAEGEWSDWVPAKLPLMPTQSIPIQVRFYLKRVRPELQLYLSPLNVDPMSPALPITTPASFAAELARATGRYYTQGMAEDTAALSASVLTRAEFLEQARMAGREVLDQFPWVLSRFKTGLLFYYVGNLDLVSHMMWRPTDAEHPAFDAKADAPFADVVPSTYEQLDGLIRYTLENMGDDALLVVMSDHGFASWRRVFHLNAWLLQRGLLALKDDARSGDFEDIDWARTRAYGFGLNGLYLNLAGREKRGIVPGNERLALMREIAARLEATIDPATGKPAVARAYLREETYEDTGRLEVGPDIVVGYARGTRCLEESALGQVGAQVFADNTKAWSADHAMDVRAVPGVLATNRPLKKAAPDLKSLAGAILAEYGIEEFPPRSRGTKERP